MASTIEIQLVGSSIGVRNTTDGKVGSWEYYPVSSVNGVTGTYNPGAGASSGLTYPFTDMCMIDIDLSEANTKQIKFDVQRVTNQPGWTADLAGVNQALLDINGWIDSVASLSGSATAANQVLMIADLGTIVDNTTDALGGQGTEYIFGTGVVTGKTYKYLVVNQDATFTTLAGSVTADLLTTLGITTNVVTKGMIIRGLNGELIEDVTLATGSVVGVL
jgi:hypothetical protein